MSAEEVSTEAVASPGTGFTPGSADPEIQAAYNRKAIDHAAALNAWRAEVLRERGPRPTTLRPLEKLLPAFDRTALGVAREYDQMGQRPVSEELEARAASAGVTLKHLGLTIGTIIGGVDLRQTDPELLALIRSVLLERKVVFFRDQHLDEDQHVAFARGFGELDAFPFGKPGDNPFILEIHHDETNPGSENGWHTDVTWMERPSLGSIAQMVVCPPVGGDTLFADSHAAYLGLPDGLAERIEHLDGINDYRVFLAGYGRRPIPDDLAEAIKTDIPFGVAHPLVRSHPETGKRALYLHGGFLRHESLFDRRTGETLDPEEARKLVAELLAQHPRPEYHCRFRWEAGSIAFWDNRAVQHYATSDYFPHQRVLRRVTVAGDRPVYAPQ